MLFKERIDNIILESEDKLIESLFNLIDKMEKIEYVNSEGVNIFLEELFTKNAPPTPRLQHQMAIAQYMRDHQLGDVNGKNPYKRKRARRIMNTLLQHDFDPDPNSYLYETIVSDYINDDGSRRRVPLDIKNIDRGDDAFTHDGTDPTSQKIQINASELGDSQAVGQLSLHHELTHHDSINQHIKNTGQDGDVTASENLSKNDPAVQMSQKANSQEYPYVNDHDKDTAELYANAKAVKNARARTSKWGQASSGPDYKNKLNEGTRPVNNHEILKYFKDISNHVKYTKDELNEIEKLYDQLKDSFEIFKKNPDDERCKQIYSMFLDECGDYNISYAFANVVDIDLKKTIRDLFTSNQPMISLSNINPLKKILLKLEKSNNNFRATLNDTSRISNGNKEINNHVKYGLQLSEKIKQIIQNMSVEKIKGNLQLAFEKIVRAESDKIDKKLKDWEMKLTKRIIVKLTTNWCVSELKNLAELIKYKPEFEKQLNWYLDSSTKMQYDFTMQYNNRFDPRAQQMINKSMQPQNQTHADVNQLQMNQIKEYFVEFYHKYCDIGSGF
jgi:hypothetical protein